MRKIECICKLNDGRIVRARYEEDRPGELSLWAFFEGEWKRIIWELKTAEVLKAVRQLKTNGEIVWYTVIRCAA